MSSEEQHVALPKLYGAPAYARPPRAVDVGERPIDPDDLPLEQERTAEERDYAARMSGSMFAPVLLGQPAPNGHGQIEARPFSLRGITGKLFRNS